MTTPTFSCPIPLQRYPRIVMAHGGGGKLMHQLIEELLLPAFDNPLINRQHDGAVFQPPTGKLVLTTDSYVVHPTIFPGGDIGALAIHGTVNDLSMCGARPLYLTLSFILEEGLLMEDLCRFVDSIRRSAQEAGVQIITGDTKVVENRGNAGLFINTAGVGVIEHDQEIAPQQIQLGDQIILSGDIGRHGIAIMAKREGLNFSTTIESDLAPLNKVVAALLDAQIEVHCLRDLTRGGLATTLIELGQTSRKQFLLQEEAIPVNSEIRAACELLGLDPLYVANEGRFVAFVPEKEAHRALEIIKNHAPTSNAALIGEVTSEQQPPLLLQNPFGVQRILSMINGEQLPRIC